MRALDRLARRTGPDAPLLPYLRPGTWPGVHACAHRSLIPYRPGPDTPYVAVGRDRGDGVDLLRFDAPDELGMDFDQLLSFAVDNLAAVPAAWDVRHVREATGRPLLLAFEADGVTSASRVLDPDFLRAGHAMLGGAVALVGVPSARALFLADGSVFAERTVQKAFVAWVRRHHQDAQGVDALSPQVFVSREGTIVGTYQPAADG